MAYGNEIIDYKNRIMKDILFNENEEYSSAIINAIDPKFKGREGEMIYQNIFPYLRIPQVQTDTKSYITMSVDMPRVSTKNYFFKNMVITINIIVHEKVMKMPSTYSATRADYIASYINRIFNNNPNYGTVPLEYVSDTEDILLNTFFMRSLRFTCDEINRIGC